MMSYQIIDTQFKIMLKGIHHILFDAATQLYSFKDSISWDDRLTDCNKDLAKKLAACVITQTSLNSRMKK